MKKSKLTREHILHHAFTLASESGLESLTFGSLATRCGMSKSGLYAHFNAKLNLQLSVLAYTNDVFAQRVIEPARSLHVESYREKIKILLKNWLGWNHSFQGRCMFLDAWNDNQSTDDPLQNALKESVSIWIDYLNIQIQKGQAAQEFCADFDSQQAAFELYGLYLSANLYYSIKGEEESLRHFWQGVEGQFNQWSTHLVANKVQRTSVPSRT